MKDKEAVVHIYDGILLGYKKEWNNGICSNMDGPEDYHTKWRKSETNIIWYHLYVEPEIWYKFFYLQNRNRLTDTEKNTYSYQRGKGGKG